MDDSSGATARMIDEIYEFSAPRFFDFIKGESEEETREAELWFETALSYAPSRMFFLFLLPVSFLFCESTDPHSLKIVFFEPLFSL